MIQKFRVILSFIHSLATVNLIGLATALPILFLMVSSCDSAYDAGSLFKPEITKYYLCLKH